MLLWDFLNLVEKFFSWRKTFAIIFSKKETMKKGVLWVLLYVEELDELNLFSIKGKKDSA
jgi:hypothetical protein